MNYGYAFIENGEERESISHILSFSKKNNIDFYFVKINFDYITNELKKRNWKKVSDQQENAEREIIFEKNSDRIFFYI
jgi:dihydroorotase